MNQMKYCLIITELWQHLMIPSPNPSPNMSSMFLNNTHQLFFKFFSAKKVNI